MGASPGVPDLSFPLTAVGATGHSCPSGVSTPDWLTFPFGFCPSANDMDS